MTLDDLSPGQQGTVTGFTSDDPPPRILEMGLLPGTTVTVVRLAPMGDPIDLKVRGYHLSIRRQEARQIEVDPT
ncbi:MAG: iron transporter [Bacteroidetes bacterium]|jgi:Fe2+ transport system protein FeoA|nr:iron transporter [Bacteroidota bacterium]